MTEMQPIDRKVFFDGLRAMVRGRALNQDQVDRASILLDALWVQPGLLRPQAAYILATAFHETDQFQTMQEYADGSNYEGRRDLGNVKPGDGKRYRGRGYVQLTGRRNYDLMSAIVGEPLIDEPDLAMRPDLAADITLYGMLDGHFTGKSLDQFVTEHRSDFVSARAVVNGRDRATLIAGYATAFEKLIEKAGFPPITEPDNWAPTPEGEKPSGRQPLKIDGGAMSFSSALGCGSSIGILCTAIAATGTLPDALMQPAVITAASTLLTALATALGLCRHVNPASSMFLTRRK